ncbi:MAG: thiamine-phosphate kinase [Candidatus Aenigmarchaeota archaeon]|nr:thiamine-phosphate kinase [Candidatus Aenigmarchaeota archaeon]
MDELGAIKLLSRKLDIGDDCAVLGVGKRKVLVTTDMLHEKTDFPKWLTPEMIGWRSALVNLSDIAAMGGKPIALVIALGMKKFDRKFLSGFSRGVAKCCSLYKCKYAGGDLDKHDELTVVGTAIGVAELPISRAGARVGDAVCVTGTLGKACYYFKKRKWLRQKPRINEGMKIARRASAMMDISDGLARSLHQMGKRSRAGFKITFEKIPLFGSEDGLFFGDDYELLFTVPKSKLRKIKGVKFSVIGEVVKSGVWIEKNGYLRKLENRGWTH